MLSEDKALEVREYYSGKQKRRQYVFMCKRKDCDNTLCVEKSAFKRVTGFCRQCARRQKPFRQTYRVLQQNATRRDIDFDLSYEDFLFLTQVGTCHYCGEAKIEWNPYPSKGAPKTNLDRKDNTRGYTFDNVVVCCKECNLMKRDWFDADEFRALRLLLKRWRESSPRDREELMYMLSSWNSEIQVLL